MESRNGARSNRSTAADARNRAWPTATSTAAVILGALCALGPQAAVAGDRANIEADGYVDAGKPTKTHGDGEELEVGPGKETFLSFRTGAINPGFSTDQLVCLQVFVEEVEAPGGIEIHLARGTFQEETLTFQNRPVTEYVVTVTVGAEDEGKSILLPVPPDAAEEFALGTANALALVAPSTGAASVTFRSREFKDNESAPVLLFGNVPDQMAVEVPIDPISGLSSTNVQDALFEVKVIAENGGGGGGTFNGDFQGNPATNVSAISSSGEPFPVSTPSGSGFTLFSNQTTFHRDVSLDGNSLLDVEIIRGKVDLVLQTGTDGFVSFQTDDRFEVLAGDASQIVSLLPGELKLCGVSQSALSGEKSALSAESGRLDPGQQGCVRIVAIDESGTFEDVLAATFTPSDGSYVSSLESPKFFRWAVATPTEDRTLLELFDTPDGPKLGPTNLLLPLGIVKGEAIAPGAVDTVHLASQSVTTDKVADAAITTQKLAPGAVVATNVGYTGPAGGPTVQDAIDGNNAIARAAQATASNALPLDGSVPMNGSLNTGGNAIVEVDNVSGIGDEWKLGYDDPTDTLLLSTKGGEIILVDDFVSGASVARFHRSASGDGQLSTQSVSFDVTPDDGGDNEVVRFVGGDPASAERLTVVAGLPGLEETVAQITTDATNNSEWHFGKVHWCDDLDASNPLCSRAGAVPSTGTAFEVTDWNGQLALRVVTSPSGEYELQGPVLGPDTVTDASLRHGFGPSEFSADDVLYQGSISASTVAAALDELAASIGGGGGLSCPASGPATLACELILPALKTSLIQSADGQRLDIGAPVIGISGDLEHFGNHQVNFGAVEFPATGARITDTAIRGFETFRFAGRDAPPQPTCTTAEEGETYFDRNLQLLCVCSDPDKDGTYDWHQVSDPAALCFDANA